MDSLKTEKLLTWLRDDLSRSEQFTDINVAIVAASQVDDAELKPWTRDYANLLLCTFDGRTISPVGIPREIAENQTTLNGWVADHLQDVLVDDLRIAWPRCPEKHGHPLTMDRQGEQSAWLCPATGKRWEMGKIYDKQH